MKTQKAVKDFRKNMGVPGIGVLYMPNNVADADKLTINGLCFEWDTAANPGAVAAGSVRLNAVAAVTPVTATASLTAAVNANVATTGVIAVNISANEVLFYNADYGTKEILIVEAISDAANVVLLGHTYGSNPIPTGIGSLAVASRACTALEVTITKMHFVFAFTPVYVIVQVRATGGAIKATDAVVTITGGRVTLTGGSAAAIANTDVVTVIAFGA